MKTKLTKDIEQALFFYLRTIQCFGVEEVTINHKFGIVDTLALSVTGNERKGYVNTWRCYEIKVSKADFYSKSKVTFIGHLNYYVMPSEVYEEVKDDIPDGIGVLIYNPKAFELRAWQYACYVQVVPKKRKLAVPESVIIRKFIGSMTREVAKAKEILWQKN